MGGPIASVLLPAPLSQAQRAELDQVIASISISVDQQADWYKPGDFCVATTAAIGGSVVRSHASLFLIGFGPPYWEARKATEYEVIDGLLRAHFGFMPTHQITFNAMCSSRDDHRILGEIAQHVAARWGGIIDLGGALYMPCWIPEALSGETIDWQKLAPYVEPHLAAIGGTIIAIPYETVRGESWVWHVVEPLFLRNWLNHPDFHMI